MFGLGVAELLIIAVILFFIFGAKRIPEIIRPRPPARDPCAAHRSRQ